MSKNMDALRSIRLFNPHDAARRAAKHGGEGVYIGYRAGSSRPYISAGWQVVRPGAPTDPDGHWSDHKHKTFNTFSFGGDRQRALAAAQEWAEAELSIADWVKIPGLGSALFPLKDAEILKGLIKTAKAAL